MHSDITELNTLVSNLDERRAASKKRTRMMKDRQVLCASTCAPPQDAPKWAVDLGRTTGTPSRHRKGTSHRLLGAHVPAIASREDISPGSSSDSD